MKRRDCRGAESPALSREGDDAGRPAYRLFAEDFSSSKGNILS